MQVDDAVPTAEAAARTRASRVGRRPPGRRGRRLGPDWLACRTGSVDGPGGALTARIGGITRIHGRSTPGRAECRLLPDPGPRPGPRRLRVVGGQELLSRVLPCTPRSCPAATCCCSPVRAAARNAPLARLRRHRQGRRDQRRLSPPDDTFVSRRPPSPPTTARSTCSAAATRSCPTAGCVGGRQTTGIRPDGPPTSTRTGSGRSPPRWRTPAGTRRSSHSAPGGYWPAPGSMRAAVWGPRVSWRSTTPCCRSGSTRCTSTVGDCRSTRTCSSWPTAACSSPAAGWTTAPRSGPASWTWTTTRSRRRRWRTSSTSSGATSRRACCSGRPRTSA